MGRLLKMLILNSVIFETDKSVLIVCATHKDKNNVGATFMVAFPDQKRRHEACAYTPIGLLRQPPRDNAVWLSITLK